MNLILILAALLNPQSANAATALEIITAAKRVVITGSASAREVTVRTTDGAPMPVRSLDNGSIVIRDADQTARIINGTYQISVPLNTELRIRVRCEVVEDQPCPNSSVTITNVGPVKFESVDGKVEIKRVAGDVDAATLYGSLTISSVKGSVNAASQTNAINVDSVTGSVLTRSSTGMTFITSALGGAKATNTTGEIKLAGRVLQSSEYSLTTDIGHIRIELADGSDAYIEANAPPERVRVRTAAARTLRVDRRRSIVVLGAGGTRITAETLNGGIDIGKR